MAKTENGTATIEDIRAMLQAEEQSRQQQFVDAYNALITEYGYGFTAVPFIDVDGRIKARLQLSKTNETR